MRGEPVYRRCKCRGGDGKELGQDCPQLRRKDGSWNPKHGSWYFALELAPGPGGKRRPRMRRGGFATKEEAIAARDEARETLRTGADPSDRTTLGAFLLAWLAGRVDLKPTTRRTYRITTETYLIPLLGHIEVRKLQPGDISGAFATIREWNASLAAGEPVRPFQRNVGPAAMRRIRDVLRAALAGAVRARMAGFNAAELVPMETVPSYRPMTWTAERIAKFWRDYEDALEKAPRDRGDRPFLVWRSPALRPFPVMVWPLAGLGAFLDYAQEKDPWLSPLFELAAGTGMRRGELCGLPWTNVDFGAGVIHVTTARVQAGWEVVQGGPKTEAGWREVALTAQDAAMLKAWKRRQAARRLEIGPLWEECGLVFTRDDGRPWHPDAVTDAFERLAFRAHLPSVRLHDIRHAHISQYFAAGIDARIVQERVGHSGSQMTRDYAAVAAEVSREAAEKVAAMIPRRARR